MESWTSDRVGKFYHQSAAAFYTEELRELSMRKFFPKCIDLVSNGIFLWPEYNGNFGIRVRERERWLGVVLELICFPFRVVRNA